MRLVVTNKHTIAYEEPLVKGRGKFFDKPNGEYCKLSVGL